MVYDDGFRRMVGGGYIDLNISVININLLSIYIYKNDPSIIHFIFLIYIFIKLFLRTIIILIIYILITEKLINYSFNF